MPGGAHVEPLRFCPQDRILREYDLCRNKPSMPLQVQMEALERRRKLTARLDTARQLYNNTFAGWFGNWSSATGTENAEEVNSINERATNGADNTNTCN